MSETHQFKVAEAEAGERLDRWLARHLAPYSRTRLKHLIEDGHVLLGGRAIRDPSAKVKPGQEISLSLPEPIADAPTPQGMALVIPYEDEHLLVVDKPAGLVVHPAPGNPDRTLVNALLAHCGAALAGIGGVKRPGIVHRLDKDTSGLMVVAKSDLAHRALAADFAAHRIERAYTAMVWGVPPVSGVIEGAIGRSTTDRKKMALVTRGGKAAVTRFRRRETFGMVAAMLECRLDTGRTHQIRVHLAARGYPLIGDPVYGGRPRPAWLRAFAPEAAAAITAFRRQALHAGLLGFTHPVTGEVLRFSSDLPSDMAELLRNLNMVKAGTR